MGRRIFAIAMLLFATAIFLGRSHFSVARAAQAPTDLAVIVPGDIPLAIENLMIVDKPVEHLTFTLRNTGAERVVAYEINWSFTFSDGKTMHSDQREDFFLGRVKLSPGEKELVKTSLPTLSKNDIGFSRIVGTVTFVELGNGSRLGSDQSQMVPWLREQRLAQLEGFRELFSIYESGGEPALARALSTDDPKEPAVKGAIRHSLLGIQQAHGPNAMIEILKDTATLRTPD